MMDPLQLKVEIAKLSVALLTPVVVAVIGYLILRQSERIKTEAGRSSLFMEKWADEFFNASMAFILSSFEFLDLVQQLSTTPNRSTLSPSEQAAVDSVKSKLRTQNAQIAAYASSATEYGRPASDAADNVLETLRQFQKHGSGAIVVGALDKFRLAAALCHRELLLGKIAE